MPDDAERPTEVEVFGTEMIAPYGEVSARAKVEDIVASRRRPHDGAGKISRRRRRGRLAWRRQRSPRA
jgi:hypothetical protein